MNHKFRFKEPGDGERDSHPIGNGEIGAMVWGGENGRLSIMISKNNSFSSALRLLKIGRLNIAIDEKGYLFDNQQLDILQGTVKIGYSKGENKVSFTVWADANNPCIRIRAKSDKPVNVSVGTIIWRTEDKRIEGGFNNRTEEYADFFGQDNDKEPIIVYGDKINEDYDDAVVWYHRNPDSHYLPSLKYQKIEDLAHLYEDPLLDRSFGGCIMSDNLEKTTPLQMKSRKGKKLQDICVGVITGINGNEKNFCCRLYEKTSDCNSLDYEEAFKEHKKYWKDFAQKSYINIGTKEADLVDSGYRIQRYMNACNGRGEFPIKFNGSIFVPDIHDDENLGPDFRRWGGGYWFQNTRLIYWSMLASGDFNLMKPFFNMYEKIFDICLAKVKKHFGFEGVLYYETMSPWGTARNIDYGRNRDDLNDAIITNPYLRYYFSGMLELLVIMIEYVKHTKNSEFEKSVLHKHARKVIAFYMNLYSQKDENGKIIIYPSQALENWQDAKNPTDAVAGLRYVLEQLLKMDTAEQEDIDTWRDFYETVPEIPVFIAGGHPDSNKPSMIKPAWEYDKLGNVENPELYAVFPYRMASFENNRETGIETYRRRGIRIDAGWTQDGIQAAVLGLPGEAARFILNKFGNWNEKCRFQGYWGPNFDWVADQDQGSSASIALQKMLLQCVDDTIYVFPAWPKDWDVEFKLHAYDNTIVECRYADGEIEYLKTTPENRKKDVVVCFDRHKLKLF